MGIARNSPHKDICEAFVPRKPQFVMQEKLDPPTDPILEECYRMKAEFAAQFNSMEELTAYLRKVNAREKTRGRKYIPAPPTPPEVLKKIESLRKNLSKVSD
ncbi:hypothetical protein C6499_09755 [Candidatus Poribacteria bacterium]|nr:MAG: hypothetical protein C6499_09755 [Candidatus Poribacteria bacterium]